ncbi:hypothetical protein WJX72_007012 [[Myrmecia] bisecta]|uniref:SET domain-containing protein n=1 Tax=[Myrmecia] bisecta TaxID=41462 RepID=A0AAW1P6H6_9CHLO
MTSNSSSPVGVCPGQGSGGGTRWCWQAGGTAACHCPAGDAVRVCGLCGEGPPAPPGRAHGEWFHRVLGQVLSPALSQQYERQLQLYSHGQLKKLAKAPLVQLLSQVPSGTHARQLEQNLQQYIARSLATADAKTPEEMMACLPPDLHVCSRVEPYTVSYAASPFAPRNQQGLRAKASISAWTIVGPYRGRTCLQAEYDSMCGAPAAWGFDGDPLEWRMKLDAYATNLECFKGLEGLDKVLLAQSQDMLPCSAFMYGNATALVNDPRRDPLANPNEPVAHLANTGILEFRVGCWVFPFLATIKHIPQGQPLLYDYGVAYWREGFAERLQLLEMRQALETTTNKHTQLEGEYARMAAALAAAQERNQALQQALQGTASGSTRAGRLQDEYLAATQEIKKALREALQGIGSESSWDQAATGSVCNIQDRCQG